MTQRPKVVVYIIARNVEVDLLMAGHLSDGSPTGGNEETDQIAFSSGNDWERLS